ncbi:MAG: outer membrane beta-barrel protein [Bacteroidales bacterium]|nr:outer membrane beta-barrel protein [Bacteroidales bacterium]
MNNDQFLNNLRGKLESYESPVPEGLWEGIEKQMAARRRRVLWMRVGGAVAACVLLAAGVLYLIGEDVDISATDVPMVAETTLAEPTAPAPADTTAPTETTPAAKIVVPKKGETIAMVEPDESVAKVDSLVADTSATAAPTEEETPRLSLLDGTTGTTTVAQQVMPLRKSTASLSRLSASLYGANMTGTQSEHGGYYEFVSGNSLPTKGYSLQSMNVALANVLYLNRNSEPITKKDHNLPLRAGVNVRYRLSDRWSIESGLFYTYLSSHLIAGTEDNCYEISQKLQFIGVPLSASFDVWRNRRFEVYVSGGGAVEKCVAGKSHTNYYVSRFIQSSDDEDVSIDKLQFSLVAAAGLQFNITDRFGIYAEPGMSYYFDNGSEVSTIYKDRPFNFDMKIGLRFSFNK